MIDVSQKESHMLRRCIVDKYLIYEPVKIDESHNETAKKVCLDLPSQYGQVSLMNIVNANFLI